MSGASIVRETAAGVVAHGIPVKELVFLPLSQFPAIGNASCLYIDIAGNNVYYWDNQQYWNLSSDNVIFSGTTAYWEEYGRQISKKDAIYIYTDFDNDNGVDIPSIKIGDGLAYIGSLPFISACGITQDDINFWNNKVSAKISPSDAEEIVFYIERE